MINLNGYKLTFSEEFNNRSIFFTGDGATWASSRDEFRHNTFDIGYGASAFVDPSSGYDPFRVANGELTITAVPDRTAAGMPGAWESGLITTQGNFSQKYGYFEMRADLNSKPGGWDAFWLVPDNPGVTGDPDRDGDWTELDIVEHYGNNDAGSYRWIHTNEGEQHPDPNTTLQVYSHNPEQVSGFHTYGVKWTPTVLEFYFDGQLMGTKPTPSDYHQAMHVIANLAVEGNGSGHGTPMEMKIDYIRIFSDDQNAVAVQQGAVSAPDGRDPGLYGATTAGTASPPVEPLPVEPSPTTPTTPTTPTPPTTPTTPTDFQPGDLKVTLSGDQYQGAPRAEIRVDGVVVATVDVTADRKQGQWQDIVVKGNGRWADGTGHDVTVTFLNDKWDGTDATDRNLWFRSAELNGVKAGGERAINSGGDWHTVRIDDALSTTPTTSDTIDKISVTAQGDEYEGYPNFVLKVDGEVIDSDNIVSAERVDGDWQTFDFLGDFDLTGTQAHKVEVIFDNDRFDGGHKDRNMYVDQVTFNGVVNDADATLMGNGGYAWDFNL